MSTSENYVQVATEGSGKKIRNLKISTYIDVNGVPTLTDVYMQVTSIVDETGQPVSLKGTEELLQQIIRQLGRLEQLMAEAWDIEIDESHEI